MINIYSFNIYINFDVIFYRMPAHSKPLAYSLALVKWISNDDDNGTYTAGIPLNWIKGFDTEEFLKRKKEDDDDDSNSYVIE